LTPPVAQWGLTPKKKQQCVPALYSVTSREPGTQGNHSFNHDTSCTNHEILGTRTGRAPANDGLHRCSSALMDWATAVQAQHLQRLQPRSLTPAAAWGSLPKELAEAYLLRAPCACPWRFTHCAGWQDSAGLAMHHEQVIQAHRAACLVGYLPLRVSPAAG
jgi:hypothetical protein